MSRPERRVAPTPAGIPRSAPPIAPSPTTHSPAASAPLLFPPPQASGHRPRRLVELFPSTPDLTSASAGRTAPSSKAAPASAARNVGRPRAPTPRISHPDEKRQRLAEIEKGAGHQSFYGLDERPFTPSTDPRFLYHSAAFDHAAQAMLDAIRRRDGIVMLTGELGRGRRCCVVR